MRVIQVNTLGPQGPAGTIQDLTGLNQFSASINTFTGSINTFTASIQNEVNALERVTGSYASTASNVFYGNQVITDGYELSVNTISEFSNGQLLIDTANLVTSTVTTRMYAGNGYHLTGSLNVLGNSNTIGDNTQIGNTILTGSLLVSGSTTQIGNNTLLGNTVLSGSIEISGSSIFHNSLFTVTGSSNFLGNINFDGNVNVISGSAFYHWGNKLFNYGAFSDTTSQSGSADTAYPIRFNTNDVVGYGINIVSQSRITVDHTGLYNLQFSAQLDRVAGSGNALVSIWLRITGSDVANSCTDIVLTGNASAAATVAAWNFVFPMSSSQYCELMWSTDDGNINISAIPTRTAPIRPAVPSVILTLTQVA